MDVNQWVLSLGIGPSQSIYMTSIVKRFLTRVSVQQNRLYPLKLVNFQFLVMTFYFVSPFSCAYTYLVYSLEKICDLTINNQWKIAINQAATLVSLLTVCMRFHCACLLAYRAVWYVATVIHGPYS